MSNSVRSATEAIAWAKRQITNPSKLYPSLCLQFTRLCFNVGPKHPDAEEAWNKAQWKHQTTNAKSIPAGVPVFWRTRSPYDHVALSIGGGKCISTDIKRRGKVDIVDIDTITKAWGGPLLGWTEDVNGVRVFFPPKVEAPKPSDMPKARPSFSVSALKAARYKHPARSGTSDRTEQVKVFEQALVKTGWLKPSLADGHYGTATVEAVKRFQRKHSGVRNGDGWMGMRELTLLVRLAGMSADVKA